jgi:hypothetical protein
MESVYHIITVHVNETSWAHVWRLRSRYLRMGYDILLENSKEWNLPPANKDPQKKLSKDLKANEVKPHLKSSMFEKRTKFTGCWERCYQKKERKEITISYSAKSYMWPHPYSHIICICTIFYSLTFPFLTPIHYTILHQPWLFATQTL